MNRNEAVYPRMRQSRTLTAVHQKEMQAQAKNHRLEHVGAKVTWDDQKSQRTISVGDVVPEHHVTGRDHVQPGAPRLIKPGSDRTERWRKGQDHECDHGQDSPNDSEGECLLGVSGSIERPRVAPVSRLDVRSRSGFGGTTSLPMIVFL